ncbi:MAG: cell division protein ZapB [Dissulfurimicrobium sp.]|uniref:cell division protein ZapB n=1 Tax=Dissulfurimicrobium TaxID=1769732 RepID=UPI001EDAB4FB|nr:cell division protein ZapB [Dissulfurimicrobium hydrothermale]UKL13818.1 cell division protein ZapB [Dissulfurimicrobium hydrothermale]
MNNDQELRTLEEKLEQLISYCERLRGEREELIKKNQELIAKLNDVEENLAKLNGEREDIRNRVSDLILKIDQLGAELPGSAESVN